MFIFVHILLIYKIAEIFAVFSFSYFVEKAFLYPTLFQCSVAGFFVCAREQIRFFSLLSRNNYTGGIKPRFPRLYNVIDIIAADKTLVCDLCSQSTPS